MLQHFYIDLLVKSSDPSSWNSPLASYGEIAKTVRTYGKESLKAETSLWKYVDAMLRRSLYNIAHGKFELGKARLKRLHTQAQPLMSTRLKGLLDLSICRFTGLDLSLDGSFNACIRLLNETIYACPLHNLGPVVGLSESLALIADAYIATGRYEEAIHSVCLALDFSAENLGQLNIQKNETQAELMDDSARLGHFLQGSVSCGPSLTAPMAMVLSLYVLACQLRVVGLRTESTLWFRLASVIAQDYYDDMEGSWCKDHIKSFKTIVAGLDKTHQASAHSDEFVVGFSVDEQGQPLIGNLVKKQIESKYSAWKNVFLRRYGAKLRVLECVEPSVVDSLALSPPVPPNRYSSQSTAGGASPTKRFHVSSRSPVKRSGATGSPFQKMSVIGDTILEDDDTSDRSVVDIRTGRQSTGVTSDNETNSLAMILNSIEAASCQIFPNGTSYAMYNDNRDESYYGTVIGDPPDIQNVPPSALSLLRRCLSFVKENLKEENDKIERELLLAKRRVVDVQKVTAAFERSFFSRGVKMFSSVNMARKSRRAFDSHFRLMTEQFVNIESNLELAEMERDLLIGSLLKAVERLNHKGGKKCCFWGGDTFTVNISYVISVSKGGRALVVTESSGVLDGAAFDWRPYTRLSETFGCTDIKAIVCNRRVDNTYDIELSSFADMTLPGDPQTSLFPLLLKFIDISDLRDDPSHINAPDCELDLGSDIGGNLSPIQDTAVLVGMEVLVKPHWGVGYVHSAHLVNEGVDGSTRQLISIDYKSGLQDHNVPLDRVFRLPQLVVTNNKHRAGCDNERLVHDSLNINPFSWDFRVGETIVTRLSHSTVWQRGCIVKQRVVSKAQGYGGGTLKCYDVIIDNGSLHYDEVRRGVLASFIRPYLSPMLCLENSGTSFPENEILPSRKTTTKLRIERAVSRVIGGENGESSEKLASWKPHRKAIESVVGATTPIRYKHPLADWPEMSKTRAFRRNKPNVLKNAKELDQQLNRSDRDIMSKLLEGGVVPLSAAEQRELADEDMRCAAAQFETSDIGQQLLVLKGAIIQDRLAAVQSESEFKIAKGASVRSLLSTERLHDESFNRGDEAFRWYSFSAAVVRIQAVARRYLASEFVKEIREQFLEQQGCKAIVQKCHEQTQGLLYKYASLTAVSSDFITTYLSIHDGENIVEPSAPDPSPRNTSGMSLCTLLSHFLNILADFCVTVTSSSWNSLSNDDLRFLNDVISHMAGISTNILDLDQVCTVREKIGYCDGIIHFFIVAKSPSSLKNYEEFLKKISDMRAGAYNMQATAIQSLVRSFLARIRFRTKTLEMRRRRAIVIQKIFRGFLIRVVAKKKRDLAEKNMKTLCQNRSFEVVEQVIQSGLAKVKVISAAESQELYRYKELSSKMETVACPPCNTNSCPGLLLSAGAICPLPKGSQVEAAHSDTLTDKKGVMSELERMAAYYTCGVIDQIATHDELIESLLHDKLGALPGTLFCEPFLQSVVSVWASMVGFAVQKVLVRRSVQQCVRSIVHNMYRMFKEGNAGANLFSDLGYFQVASLNIISDCLNIVADYKEPSYTNDISLLQKELERSMRNITFSADFSGELLASFAARNISATFSCIIDKMESGLIIVGNNCAWDGFVTEAITCLVKLMSKINSATDTTPRKVEEKRSMGMNVEKRMLLAACQRFQTVVDGAKYETLDHEAIEGADANSDSPHQAELDILISSCSADILERIFVPEYHDKRNFDEQASHIILSLSEEVGNYLAVLLL